MKYTIVAYAIVAGAVLVYRFFLVKECNSLRNLLNPRKK